MILNSPSPLSCSRIALVVNNSWTTWTLLHPPIASTQCQCSNSTVGSVPSPFRNRDQEKDQNGVLASGWDLSLVVTCRSRISSSFTARQREIHSPDGSNPYAFACVGTPSYQQSSKSPTGSVGDETGPSCDIFPGIVAYTTRLDYDSRLSCLSSASYSQSTVSLLIVSKQGESFSVFPWYRRDRSFGAMPPALALTWLRGLYSVRRMTNKRISFPFLYLGVKLKLMEYHYIKRDFVTFNNRVDSLEALSTSRA